GDLRYHTGPSRLRIDRQLDGQVRTAIVQLSMPTESHPDRLLWLLELPPHGEAELCIEVALQVDGEGEAPRFRCGPSDDDALPASRHRSWWEAVPRFETDDRRLARAVARATEDLGALRIFD